MKYYLLQTPDFFTDGIEIIDFHKAVDYGAFYKDAMHRIPSGRIFQIRHGEYAAYPHILLEPLPLFSESARETIQLYMGKLFHVHFILMDEETRDYNHYYCPSLRRISGKTEPVPRLGKAGGIRVYLDGKMPEDLSLLYLKTEGGIQVLLGLDLAESLMRKGLNDINLVPAEIKEG